MHSNNGMAPVPWNDYTRDYHLDPTVFIFYILRHSYSIYFIWIYLIAIILIQLLLKTIGKVLHAFDTYFSSLKFLSGMYLILNDWLRDICDEKFNK